MPWNAPVQGLLGLRTWRIIGLADIGTNLDRRCRSTAGRGKSPKAPEANARSPAGEHGFHGPAPKKLDPCVAQAQHSRPSFAGCPLGDTWSDNCHAIACAAGLVQKAMAFFWGAMSDPKRRCVLRVLLFCS